MLHCARQDGASRHIKVTYFGLKMERRSAKKCSRGTEEEHHGVESHKNLNCFPSMAADGRTSIRFQLFFKEAGNGFHYLFNSYTLKDEYCHSSTSDATIMVPYKFPIIGKQVAKQVTIATILSANNTLNYSLFERL